METTILASKIKYHLKRFIKKIYLPSTNTIPPSLPTKKQEWSIGIYVGESPCNFIPSENLVNPVLTRADVSDIPAAFVADPFMLREQRTWYMFFEVMNLETSKGEIGLAISENGLKWRYQQIVLNEPFHLSYPYVFEWKNEYYMVPESYKANSIRLYKAVDFPKRWSFVGNLIDGNDYVDPSIFHFNDKWWLLASLGTPPFRADILRLYYADEMMGPWMEHPKSPIINGNSHIARPAGRVLILNDRAIRYTQDCYSDYGTLVRGFEITELTTTSYHEREIGSNPVLAATGAGWNEAGMHHLDPHWMDGQWIACVDGCFWRQD